MATQFTHPAEHIGSIDTSRFECIDGKLLERPVPTIDHSHIQENLALLLRPLARAQNRGSGPELSVDRRAGSKSDWMTPDYSVSMPGGFTANQNRHALPPVYLLVEILSPEQTMAEMERKGQRYLDWGALHIWLVDLAKQRAVVLHQGGIRQEVGIDGTMFADPNFGVSLAAVLAD